MDEARTTVGHPCGRCKVPGDGGLEYFHIGVWSLINLMQEFFHSNATPVNADTIGTEPDNTHPLGVVIFFCSLTEVLMENFIEEVMCEQKIPPNLQERLLQDSLFFKRRAEKLVPSLIKDKWSAAVAAVSTSEKNFKATLDFYYDTAKKRNVFLHRGERWEIPKELPRECLDSIPQLLEFFVRLHNRYVARKLDV